MPTSIIEGLDLGRSCVSKKLHQTIIIEPLAPLLCQLAWQPNLPLQQQTLLGTYYVHIHTLASTEALTNHNINYAVTLMKKSAIYML